MNKENNNQQNLTYEMVMEMFAESSIKSEKEYERLRKLQEEISLQQKDTDKKIKELSKNIGGIAHSNGAMAEEMVFNVVSKDNTFANVKFDDVQRNIQVQTERLKTMTEIDIVMMNGDTIALLETKYKVEKKDVKNMLSTKLPYFRQYLPQFNKHKIILGIGGMSFDKEVLEEAIENGIGIVKIVGDGVEFLTDNIMIY